MHFTEPIYRNPNRPTWPLLQITQGCTHNRCKFCTMYAGIPFRPMTMEEIEEDLAEIARRTPNAATLQLLSANPLALNFRRMKPIFELIHQYLPDIEEIYLQTRVSDLYRKTVDDLKWMKDMGLAEIGLGVESGDDWTLERIEKGYTSQDILEQCAKLDEAGMPYGMTFLNGVAGAAHSQQHAINSAKIFNQCHPTYVGSGGLTLFPGTKLLEEAERGEFDPLDERGMLQEMRTFYEHLEINCSILTHHTLGANLSGSNFLGRKQYILDKLDDLIENGNMEQLAYWRSKKTNL